MPVCFLNCFAMLKNFLYSFAILFVCFADRLSAQVVFVDAVKGNDAARGIAREPLASLEKAVDLANRFTGKEPITIKIAPGLYILKDKLTIGSGELGNDSAVYSIEAAVLPDDPDWLPAKMPVIQSVSADNSPTQFPHATGFLVAASHVAFKGLKFIGNANPEVKYYYPISRESESYNGLTVSQCYFIGDKNAAPIQGALWAHGRGIKVEHSIFYGCKNALLLFRSIKDFSVTNSIIYGAYEAAVWFGPFEAAFTFRNNIVANCNYFWIRREDTYPKYTFNNSIITGNKYFMGMYTSNGLVEAVKNEHIEIAVRKEGKILLSEVETKGLPNDYLNPLPQSDGRELNAGIFKKAKQTAEK